jgi:hypothetical protein
VFVRELIRRCLKALLVHVGSLLIVRSGIHAPRPVEAGARVVVDGGVVDYRAVHISVVDHGSVDVSHCGVITIRAARPAPAIETDTAETETIVDTAVESNMRTPVAGVPLVQAIPKSPISRRPQNSDARRSDPNAGHPVVAHRTIGPVAKGILLSDRVVGYKPATPAAQY